MGFLLDSAAALIKIGLNVTGNKRDYMKWRTSDEGKRYFKKKEDNEFYKALAKGDTTVIDSGIKEKQDRIRKLKQELGLMVLPFILMLSVCGCSTNYTIPRSDPLTVPEALKAGEHTYVIKDFRIRTSNEGDVTLRGNWHIVSPEFMKDHVRNQDDLIAVLEILKKERRMAAVNKYALFGLIVLLGNCLYSKARGKKDGSIST